MKRSLALKIMVFALAMLVMVSCSSSSFGMTAVDEKTMNITAENSDVDDSATAGSIVVGEDEQITIDSNLESGSITLEFISDEGFDDIDEYPDLDSVEPVYTTTVTGVESQAVVFGSGSFLVRATVTDKATGTVDIVVKGFAEE